MREKVFITGGSGLLAINWALAIRNRFTVSLGLYDRPISLAGIEAQYISLESVNDLSSFFKIIRPQVVIHTAGLTSIEACEAKPDLARQVNVELSANVAKVCYNDGLKLVHISTDHLFSGTASLLDETAQTSPINVYGRTKAEAELRVLEEYPEALVVRTNFYGWGPSYRQSFSDTIIEHLRSGNEVNLFKDVFYTPILAQTLANVVHELINNRARGIYNVVGDERISKYEFGLKIAKQFKLDTNLIKPISMTDKLNLVKRPLDMSLSNNKVSHFLGRKLGGIDEHVFELYKQEQLGVAHEIQKL